MKLFAFALVILALAAGCSSDPTVVTIETTQPPALIAFRDEASATWEIPTSAGGATFEVEVTGPYRVVVGCENRSFALSILITEYARTPADASLIEHPCKTTPDPFEVSGMLAQPGAVGLGNRFSITSGASGSFALPAPAGSHDLVMLSGDFSAGFEKLAIRRDLAVSGDIDLGTIDLNQEGAQALVPVTFTPANLEQGELLNSSTQLITASSFGLLQNAAPQARPTWEARLAPESMLRATDRQSVQLFARRTSGALSFARGVRRDVHLGDPTSVTLPEPLGPVTFDTTIDRLAATWTTLPGYDELELRRFSILTGGGGGGGSRDITHRIFMSRAFVDATGETSVVLELAVVPGFKSEWRHDPVVMQTRSFIANRGAPSDVASSSVSPI